MQMGTSSFCSVLPPVLRGLSTATRFPPIGGSHTRQAWQPKPFWGLPAWRWLLIAWKMRSRAICRGEGGGCG